MIADRIVSIYVRLFRLIYAHRFKRFGRKVFVIFPNRIEGFERISLGNSVYIASNTYLCASPHTGATNCQLDIGDGTMIGRNNYIYATKKINIGRNVLTAPGVYISDNTHEYKNPLEPIQCQPVKQLQEVTIGEGAWLGYNVCIIGANVGKQSVIGANAVVTRDIPDHCVAVGVPAKIIRRYDHALKIWRSTDLNGLFFD